MYREIRRYALTLSLIAPMVASGAGWSPEHQSLIAGDFDGDGADDLFILPTSPAWPCELVTSSSAGTLDTLLQLWESSDCLGSGAPGMDFEGTPGNFDGTYGDDLLLMRTDVAGNSFVYQSGAAGGGLTVLGQTVAPGTFGFSVSAATHHAVSGQFTVDGNADLLLQGKIAANAHGVAQSSISGTFSLASPTWVEADHHLGVSWVEQRATLHVGDFNGDGTDDVLVQPSRRPVLLPMKPSVLVVSQAVHIFTGDGSGGFTAFEKIPPGALPFDLARNEYELIIADFNGDGFDDVFAQSRYAERDSYMVISNTLGGGVASGEVTSISDATHGSNWSAEAFKVVAGNFTGGSSAQLYKLAADAAIANEVVSFTGSGAVSSILSHTPPTVQAPRVDNITAVTAGSGGVDINGSASYSVPIFTPVGIGGISPGVSLTYSSNKGNGLAGVGWSIGGMSSIGRCPQTIAQDDNVTAVNYSSDDRFCIDGQRLLLVAGAAYGANNAQYRTEIDNFARVTSYDDGNQSPGYFRVELPNGEVLLYGNSASSRIEAGTSNGVGPVRAWALTSRCDRFNNCIEYVYEEDLVAGEYYPSSIEYTQQDGAAGHYQVGFRYETRPLTDVWEGYRGGYRHRLSKRLESILVFHRAQAVDPWSWIRDYELKYHTRVVGGSGRSRLAYIQERAQSEGNGARDLRPIRFDWQIGVNGWGATSTVSQATVDLASVRIGDVDNDGYQDVIAATDGHWDVLHGGATGTLTAETDTVAITDTDYTFLADFDGDGTDDLLMPQGESWWLHLSAGDYPDQGISADAFAVAINTGIAAEGLSAGGVTVADMTGDALPDLIYSNAGTIYLRENTGGGFSNAITAQFTEALLLAGEEDFQSALRESRVLDFDGDGRQDLLARVVVPPDSAPTWTSDAAHFQFTPFTLDWQGGSSQWELITQTSGGTWSPPELHTQSFSVITQEGTFDFQVRGRNEVGQVGPWSAIRSHQFISDDGFGANTAPDGSNPAPLNGQIASAQWEVVRYDGTSLSVFANLGSVASPLPLDMNGDGRTDIAFVDQSGHWVTRLSDGVSFTVDAGSGIFNSSTYSPFVVDFNRDGRQDLAFAARNGGDITLKVALSNGSSLDPLVDVREVSGSDFTGSIRDAGRVRTVDVNGDGYPGVAIYFGDAGEWRIDEQTSLPADLMTRATDGVGNFVDYHYEPYARVRADVGVEPPELLAEVMSSPVSRPYRGSRRVVTRREGNDGAGGAYTIDYIYAGAILNTHGRGLQGFRKRTMADSRDLPSSTAWQHRAFPFTGSSALVRSYDPSSGRAITSVRSQWESKPNAYSLASTHVLYPGAVTTQRWELGATAGQAPFVQSVQTIAAIDVNANGFGEVSKITTEVSAPTDPAMHRTVVTTTYDTAADTGAQVAPRYCILPSRVEVERSTLGSGLGTGTATRATGYPVRDLTHCRIDGIDLNSDAAGNDHETLFTRLQRDDVGNVKRVETWESGALQSSARRTAIHYDQARPQYPTSVASGPGAFGGTGVVVSEAFTWQDDLGLLKTTTVNPDPIDGTGPTAYLAYDVLGRVVTATDADGSEIHTTYDWCKHQFSGGCALPNATFLVSSHVDYTQSTGGRRDAGASRTVLDGYAREIGSYSSEAGALNELPGMYRQFDGRGFVSRVSTSPVAYLDTAFFDDAVAIPVYDILGRVISSEAPTKENDTADTTTTHLGLVTEATDNRGALWRYTHDARGRLVKVENPDPVLGSAGPATSYVYTQFDELATITDPDGKHTTATYNGLGHRTSLTDPNSGQWQFQNSAFGELIMQASPKQVVAGTNTRWTYDRLGRMTQRVEAEGTTYWRYHDTTNAPWRGMLHEVEYPVSVLGAGTRTERYTYDDLRRLTQWRDVGSGKAIDLAYDGISRVETLTYPSVNSTRFAVNYAYDERSRVSTVTSGRFDQNAPDEWVAHGTLYTANQFDRFGTTTDFDLGNGVKVTAQTDIAVGAVRELTDSITGGGTIQHFIYDWDANGNVVQRNDLQHSVNETFAYDYMNAMTSHTVVHASGGYTDDYTIGDTGNLEQHPQHGTYDYLGTAPHQLTSTSLVPGTPDVTYTYDANGNQRTRTEGATSDTHTWASFDLPTELTHGTASAQFDYGAHRELVAVRRSDSAGASEISEYFTDLAERVTRGSAEKHKFYVYVEGRMVAQEVVDSVGVGETEYFHYDRQGSVTAVTDASGGLLEEHRYDPYGQRRLLDGAKDLGATLLGSLPGRTQFGYTGHEHADVVGLIHMRGRVYDPGIGRMLSVDPVMRDALNVRSHHGYSYVEGNPATYVDPTGFAVEIDDAPTPQLVTPDSPACGNEGPPICGASGPSETGGRLFSWVCSAGHAGCFFGTFRNSSASAAFDLRRANQLIQGAPTGASTPPLGIPSPDSAHAYDVDRNVTRLAQDANGNLFSVAPAPEAATLLTSPVASNARVPRWSRVVAGLAVGTVTGVAAGAAIGACIAAAPACAYAAVALAAYGVGSEVSSGFAGTRGVIRSAGRILRGEGEFADGLTIAGILGLIRGRVGGRVPNAGSIRNVNPTRGTQNCVNCVIATDATLAGSPASALPGGPFRISVLESYFGSTFRAVSGKSEIERILQASGPGSRGIVFGERGGGVGHVFNAVNQNGVIRFLDGQTGKAASFEGFSSFRFLPTN